MTPQNIVAALTSYWREVLGTLLALIAIWQSYRSNRFAKLLARLEGSFDKPNLEIGMFGHVKTTHFLILAPITPAPLSFPIPLNLRNLGAATSKEIRLIVRGNENLLPYSRDWLEQEKPDASGSVIASFLGKEGHVNTVMFCIAHLHPGMPLNLINTAILGSTTSPTISVPIKTSDGAAGTITFVVDFSYQFDLVLFQEDEGPIAQSFRLSVLDSGAMSTRDALQKYWRSNFPTSTPRPRRFWHRRLKEKVRRICVVTVDEKKFEQQEGSNREVPASALLGSEGAMTENWFLVPALGVELNELDLLPVDQS